MCVFVRARVMRNPFRSFGIDPTLMPIDTHFLYLLHFGGPPCRVISSMSVCVVLCVSDECEIRKNEGYPGLALGYS